MNALVATHASLIVAALMGSCLARAWPLASAFAAGLGVDAVYAFAWGWPQGVLASLIGPAAVIIAATLTFGVRPSRALALAVPPLLLSPYILAEGPRLGSSGIAWCLVGAHLYAGAVGLVTLFLAHHKAPRLHARLVALFVATCAPSAYGWSCRALGGSMRPAAILDCVFLTAIVVWSVAAWARRQST